jgi:pimeloyl-ACP methyl ester carboxylesterase
VDFKRPPKWKRILKRAACVALATVATAGLAGWLVQWRRDVRFRKSHPPPGRMVEVDGHKIHCRERGDGALTFVMEPGLGDYSGSWGALEPALAELGRVFMYDRAGLGWSEACAYPRSVPQLAAELHRVLEAAHVPRPYILVGHSLGGAIVTLYAMDHPENVAGLLLLDPSHKDQFTKLPSPPLALTFLMAQLSRTAPIGLPQLMMGSRPVTGQTKHVQTAGAEMRAALELNKAWGDRRIDFGNTPIYVLTGGALNHVPGRSETEKKSTWTIWHALHAELVAASSSAVRQHIVVANAPHYMHHAHSAAVVEAARSLVERLQSEGAGVTTIH